MVELAAFVVVTVCVAVVAAVCALAGETSFGDLTFERGVTVDPSFEEWANMVWFYPNSGSPQLSGDLRRDLAIDLLNEAGQAVTTFHVSRCWPSAYTTLPELGASPDHVVIETITLQHEGWTRVDADAAAAASPR